MRNFCSTIIDLLCHPVVNQLPWRALIRHVVPGSSADITSKQQQTLFGIGITCSAADNGIAIAHASVSVCVSAWVCAVNTLRGVVGRPDWCHFSCLSDSRCHRWWKPWILEHFASAPEVRSSNWVMGYRNSSELSGLERTLAPIGQIPKIANS